MACWLAETHGTRCTLLQVPQKQIWNLQWYLTRIHWRLFTWWWKKSNLILTKKLPQRYALLNKSFFCSHSSLLKVEPWTTLYYHKSLNEKLIANASKITHNICLDMIMHLKQNQHTYFNVQLLIYWCMPQ